MEYDETSNKNSVGNEKILEKLCESVLSKQTNSEGIEGLAKKLAENVKNPDDAAELIKKMDKTKEKRNDILMIVYQQGKIFKRFKTDNKFINVVTIIEISKATINFKIAIVKFFDGYPKIKKSFISLYYLKNNFRVIKEVCQEHASEF